MGPSWKPARFMRSGHVTHADNQKLCVTSIVILAHSMLCGIAHCRSNRQLPSEIHILYVSSGASSRCSSQDVAITQLKYRSQPCLSHVDYHAECNGEEEEGGKGLSWEYCCAHQVPAAYWQASAERLTRIDWTELEANYI